MPKYVSNHIEADTIKSVIHSDTQPNQMIQHIKSNTLERTDIKREGNIRPTLKPSVEMNMDFDMNIETEETSLEKKIVRGPLSSSIRLRQGSVWTSGVRPGCVYWWCYSHPQSPAPVGYLQKRTISQQKLINESWLSKMRSRYPDHFNKFHANVSTYYSEPKDHFDIKNVKISNGIFHIYNPDQETKLLLKTKLNTYEIEKNKNFHSKQQMKNRKNKKNLNLNLAGSKTEYQLPCYESVDIKAQKDMKLKNQLCPKIIVHENSNLDLTKECDHEIIDQTLFFLAPHFPGNFFHIMNDNLIPLITDIQATPGCDPIPLRCHAKASLAQFW